MWVRSGKYSEIGWFRTVDVRVPGRRNGWEWRSGPIGAVRGIRGREIFWVLNPWRDYYEPMEVLHASRR